MNLKKRIERYCGAGEMAGGEAGESQKEN